MLVAASACSGATDSDGVDEETDAQDVAASPAEPITTPEAAAANGPNGATATVTIGSEVYEVVGDVACLTGGALAFTFANGTDQITINHSNDVILIRMTIAGADWVDAGSPPAPVVIGGGAGAVVTWSGPMSSDGVSETVSIEAHC